jgi:hypothetical protein
MTDTNNELDEGIFKALPDIVACTVHLESPAHGIVVLQLPSPTSIASTLHHMTALESRGHSCGL